MALTTIIWLMSELACACGYHYRRNGQVWKTCRNCGTRT